jgi:DNA-binding PucR family transcriptional regulator
MAAVIEPEDGLRQLRSGSPDLDVAAAPGEGWLALRDKRGDHIVELVARMHTQAEQYVDRAVRRIIDVVGTYDEEQAVERDDLWWSAYRNLEVVLIAMAEERRLADSELAIRRELGRRRAQQGMPIEDVMRAFRVGYTVLWEALSEVAGQLGPEYAQALLDRAAHVWGMFDQVTSAVADAHREVVATQHQDRRRRGLGFLAGLQRHPEGHETTEELVRSLGLDPAGSFTVAVLPALDRSLPMQPDTIVVEQPDRTVVVSGCAGEAARTEASLAGLLRRHQLRYIGVGIMRRGLAGAQQSLSDAEWAYRGALALDVPVLLFREAWVECLALRHQEQLGVLVAPAVQTLQHDEELCQTLQAYLEADGNLTAAGKALYVHPNTVGYRLKQFAARTGVDPRTATGTALVQVALVFARMRDSGVAVVYGPGAPVAR